MAFEIDGERIAAVRLVLNPAKLQRIGASTA